MKKKFILFGVLIFIIFGTFSIMQYMRYTTFQKLVLKGKDSVYKVAIIRQGADGRTEAILSIDDEKSKKRLVEDFSKMKLKKVFDQGGSIGKYLILIYYNTGSYTLMVSQKDGRFLTINDEGKSWTYKIVNKVNYLKMIDNDNLDWEYLNKKR